MKFFFDNHLAPKLAHGLNEMVEPEHQVVHLKDDFPGNTEDVVWMQALANEADLVDCDRRRPHQPQPARSAGVETSGAHDLLSETGLGEPAVLGSSQQIHQMLSSNPSRSRARRSRHSFPCGDKWQDRAP